MKPDFYSKGSELSKQGIFQILAEETWRDGEVSGTDSKILEGLRKYLRLDNQVAMEVLDLAEEKFRSHQIGKLRDFSKSQCYARALRYAFSDGEILSKREEKYLRGLRAALGLREKDHLKILERLSKKGWQPGIASASTYAAESVSARPEELLQELRSRVEAEAKAGGEAKALLESEPDPQAGPQAEVPAAEVAPSPREGESPELAGIANLDPPSEDTPPPAEDGTHPHLSEAVLQGIPPAPQDVVAEGSPFHAGSLQLNHPLPEEEEAPPEGSPSDEDSPEINPEDFESDPDEVFQRRKEARQASPKKKRLRRQPDPVEPPPTPSLRERLKDLPPQVRTLVLIAIFSGAMILTFPLFFRGQGTGVQPFFQLPGSSPRSYERLEKKYGKSSYEVHPFRIQAPSQGPALDLSDAWDLYAGRDGFLYGTASYRIFRIHAGTGALEWVAGSGSLGEPADGGDPKTAPMDPSNPCVDKKGTIYFQQGTSGIFRIPKGGQLERLLGNPGIRMTWKDGDPARLAKPGTIEQLAVDTADRLYFDEYSGTDRGPEILGRFELGDRLRALFLFAREPIRHPYRKLRKSFIGGGSGFENLTPGLDGRIYFVVNRKLYRWKPGTKKPEYVLPNPPSDFAIDSEGSLIVPQGNRIERWVKPLDWGPQGRQIEVLAGGSDKGIPSTSVDHPIPASAVGYHQPREITLAPDGTIFLLDGMTGGEGLAKLRIDRIRKGKQG